MLWDYELSTQTIKYDISHTIRTRSVTPAVTRTLPARVTNSTVKKGARQHKMATLSSERRAN